MAHPATLVIDDDPFFGDTLQQALHGYQVTVVCAADVASARKHLDEGSFCALVLDIVLADGSGFDVLRYMTEKQMAIPTVVVTKKLPSYVREMLDEEHVKLVLPKPVEMKLLGAIVLGLCGINI
ncbi:MAG TPA: response regulator [Thermoanaerobaculia bacterium]|jgi:DNA-binding NtrC family response regulator